MSNLQSGNYHVILKSGSSQNPMGLGVKTDHEGNFWCVVTTGLQTTDIWKLTPLEGTDGFYLSNNFGEGEIFANFATDGGPINLNELDPWNEQFVLRVDDTGDGWVAINNHDQSRVFDATGNDPTLGVNVICFGWNGGDNQRWKFIPV